MVLHHVWNMKGQLWAVPQLQANRFLYCMEWFGVVRDPGCLRREGLTATWLFRHLHGCEELFTQRFNVQVPVTEGWLTLVCSPDFAFFIFLNLLSPSGPIKGRARHCMMLLWWPTALVLFWSHVLVVTKFKLLPTFLMLFTYLGSGGWKLLTYLPKPTTLPLAKVFKSCRLLSESPRSV